jgi:hypothetical protein
MEIKLNTIVKKPFSEETTIVEREFDTLEIISWVCTEKSCYMEVVDLFQKDNELVEITRESYEYLSNNLKSYKNTLAKDESDSDNNLKIDDRVLASFNINDSFLEINGDMIHKVVIRHKDKRYSFNMDKILEFLCVEEK